jgi:hypothetical protein
VSGVQKVKITSPSGDIVTAFNQAVALRSVDLVYRGRAL